MPLHLPPITRRQFVAGSLAASAVTLLAEQLPAAGRQVDAARYALLADIHISQNRKKSYPMAGLTVNMTESLAQVIREVLALDPLPTAAIIAGDCADQIGLPGDYAVVVDLIKPLRASGVSVHLMLGNHDHRENFFDAFPDVRPKGEPDVLGKHVSVVSSPHACWFLLDSLEGTNESSGALGKIQLEWLDATLGDHADKPALVIAHHDPARRDAALADFDALYEVILSHKHVKAYFYGHTHRWERPFGDRIHLINLPTTAWIFDVRQPRGWVDARLHADGVTLVLNTLNKKDPANGEIVQLRWQT